MRQKAAHFFYWKAREANTLYGSCRELHTFVERHRATDFSMEATKVTHFAWDYMDHHLCMRDTWRRCTPCLGATFAFELKGQGEGREQRYKLLQMLKRDYISALLHRSYADLYWKCEVLYGSYLESYTPLYGGYRELHTFCVARTGRELGTLEWNPQATNNYMGYKKRALHIVEM